MLLYVIIYCHYKSQKIKLRAPEKCLHFSLPENLAGSQPSHSSSIPGLSQQARAMCQQVAVHAPVFRPEMAGFLMEKEFYHGFIDEMLGVRPSDPAETLEI